MSFRTALDIVREYAAEEEFLVTEFFCREKKFFCFRKKTFLGTDVVFSTDSNGTFHEVLDKTIQSLRDPALEEIVLDSCSRKYREFEFSDVMHSIWRIANMLESYDAPREIGARELVR